MVISLKKTISYSFAIFLILSFVCSSSAVEPSTLADLIAQKIKNSVLNKDVQVEHIRFIGLQPSGNCIPEDVKIQEIKRPSSVEFTFNCGKKQYRALAVYGILTKVYVTQKTLKRGDIINSEDVIELKYPLNRIPTGAITDRNLLIGKTVKRSLAQGLIIKEDYLYPGILVKKGSRVNITIKSGQVTIMTEGALKSDAVVGGNALVQCFQTGKEVAGKLLDRDKLEVSL